MWTQNEREVAMTLFSLTVSISSTFTLFLFALA